MKADYTKNRDELVALLAKHTYGERYQHSLNVEQEALALAKHYGMDPAKAGLAGLLHDITKQMDNGALAQRYGIAQLSEKTLHGKTGACWLEEQGIVTDEEVLTAIKYHTTGRADMGLLEKIIYVADYIEPLREFPEAKLLREYAYEDIGKAVLYELQISLQSVIERALPIDMDSVAAYNCYIKYR